MFGVACHGGGFSVIESWNTRQAKVELQHAPTRLVGLNKILAAGAQGFQWSVQLLR